MVHLPFDMSPFVLGSSAPSAAGVPSSPSFPPPLSPLLAFSAGDLYGSVTNWLMTGLTGFGCVSVNGSSRVRSLKHKVTKIYTVVSSAIKM